METSTSTRKTQRRRRSWCECCSVDLDERSGIENGDQNVGEKIGDGNLAGVMNGGLEPPARHLVIMVNGIIGSASDWKFGADRFRKRLGTRVAIHCSACNSGYGGTCDGVDTMGNRLADEVREIINVTKGLEKISFVAHSLGGLVSRYAIAKLYQPPDSDRPEARIGGLEPVNFITVATPHVGSRGNQNLPSLLGIQLLEKAAPVMAHWFVGRTGKHLFMTDGNKDDLPLLRRMVTDCKEGPFFSSLKAFKRRTVYANVVYDRAVGWRTSSLRRKSELPVIEHQPVDTRYPHIVRDECVEANPKKARAEDPIEEEILAGLNQLSWRRVDVSFKGAKAAFQAHNVIQVKIEKAHKEGKDVIDHIIDKHFLEEGSDDSQQNYDSSEDEEGFGDSQPNYDSSKVHRTGDSVLTNEGVPRLILPD